jgi:hypothetical protein
MFMSKGIDDWYEGLTEDMLRRYNSRAEIHKLNRRDQEKVIDSVERMGKKKAGILDGSINTPTLDNLAYDLYLDAKTHQKDLVVYPFSGYDIDAIRPFMKRYKKRFLIDWQLGTLSSNSRGQEGRLRLDTAGVNALRSASVEYIVHDLRYGLPNKGNRLLRENNQGEFSEASVFFGRTDGKFFYPRNNKKEELIKTDSIDLMLLKGWNIAKYARLQEDMKEALKEGAVIIDMPADRLGSMHMKYRNKDFRALGGGERWYSTQPQLIYSRHGTNPCGMQSYTVPLDYSFDDDGKEKLGSLMGYPVHHLSDLLKMYFLRVRKISAAKE